MLTIFRKLRWQYIRNNLPSVVFLMTYLVCLLSLGIFRFYIYLDTNPFLAIARACGQMLNAASAFAVLLVCRTSISSLHNFGFSPYLPLDHYIYFHKLTGWLIILFSAGHVFAHLLNLYLISQITTIKYSLLLWSPSLGIGWAFGLACITGWILCVIVIAMVLFSMNFVRRTGKFELFFRSHQLYMAYYLIGILHAPKFGVWIALPLSLYLIERLYRHYRSKGEHHGNTYAVEGSLLPSKVTRLIIVKPANFRFRAGDFVYVNIPSITEREWHPITISSAPEDEFITLHIRAVGEWTNRLYDRFEAEQSQSLRNRIRNAQLDEPHYVTPSSTDINARLESIKNDPLALGTVILRVPEGCDENGCSRKSNLKRGSVVFYRKSNGDQLELGALEDNNNNNNDYDEVYDDLRKPSTDRTFCESSYRLISGETSKSLSLKNLKAELELGTKNGIRLAAPMKVILDGPFGAPSSNIFNTEHAVLISTGIGVTPFASILQSIMHRYTEDCRTCPNCEHTYSEKVLPHGHKGMKLRKVDFIWINRDHSAFEWFVEKLEKMCQDQLAVPGPTSGQRESFLDVHLYVTGTLPASFSSPRLNFNNSRPDWKGLFNRIHEKDQGKVTVFYCGKPDLGTTVRSFCNDFNFAFKKEVF